MADDEQVKRKPTAIYRAALEAVLLELDMVKKQKNDLAAREIQLNETIKALSPLVGDLIPDLKEYSLSSAIRLIFRGLPTGRTLKALEVKSRLEEIGYDLSKYENPLANIHTCLKRMVESEELLRGDNEGKKKTFEAGPELKDVPELDTVNQQEQKEE